VVDVTQRLAICYKSIGDEKGLMEVYEKTWNVCKNKDVKKETTKWEQQKANLGYATGKILLKNGRLYDALKIQKTVKNMFKKICSKKEMADTCLELGRIYELLNDYELSRWSYKDALRIYKRIDAKDKIAITEVNLGRLEIKTGLAYDAINHLEDATKYFAQMKENKSLNLANQLLDAARKLKSIR
jgi:tetratricopeptide (TPR) repeat protein